MSQVLVECSFCGTEFERSKRKANEAQRQNYRQYCSPECLNKSRTLSYNTVCSWCGVEISVKIAEYRRSKSKRFFCTKSCAASFNGRGKTQPEETKRKISEKLTRNENKSNQNNNKSKSQHRLPERECLTCGRTFQPRCNHHVLCSVKCRTIYQFGSLPYTLEEVNLQLAQIRQYTNTAPSSKKVEKRLFGAVRRFYGTWNEAMKEFGFTPNTQWMSRKRIKCLDGHIADSISEMLVDNWLYSNNITHERNKPYPNGSNMDCDFYLPDSDIWLEYFGLLGEHDEYDEKVKKKFDFAYKHGLNLIGATDEHLYPEVNLDKLGLY